MLMCPRETKKAVNAEGAHTHFRSYVHVTRRGSMSLVLCPLPPRGCHALKASTISLQVRWGEVSEWVERHDTPSDGVREWGAG